MWLFFERTLRGRRCAPPPSTAWARGLMGISTVNAGRLSFTLAAFIGALSGLLIGPTDHLLRQRLPDRPQGLRRRRVCRPASYPQAAIGALALGILETFGAFWSSAFKR